MGYLIHVKGSLRATVTGAAEVDVKPSSGVRSPLKMSKTGPFQSPPPVLRTRAKPTALHSMCLQTRSSPATEGACAWSSLGPGAENGLRRWF